MVTADVSVPIEEPTTVPDVIVEIRLSCVSWRQVYVL